jgi:hypothetical protein
VEGGQWINASRERPCLVCGKPDWCTFSRDGGTLHCRRGHDLPAPVGYRLSRRQGSDAARFVRDRGVDALAYDPSVYRPVVVKSRPPAALPARDWRSLADEYRTTAGDRIGQLAADLGVVADALHAIGVGWNGRAWTIPTRDAAGLVIGLATRFPDGSKRFVRDGRSGLFYAPGQWGQGAGPVFLVEGMTDAAALLSLGLAVIGRPSNTGGVRHLVEMLADWPEDRGIVVVGERDEKPDGDWPGRNGAVKTAERLADQLYRHVAWTLPPEPFKDSRAFVRSGADADAVAFAYADAAVVIRGTARPPHEDAAADIGMARPLDEYRRELQAAKFEAVALPGVRVDRAPTGAGKTRSTVEALLIVGKARSVTCLPTHANIREREAEMLAAGHRPRKVGVMPELTADNCTAFEVASAARAAGMSHGLAVCPSCPHRKGCEYARQSARARGRQHLITTAEHYRRSWSTKTMQSRSVVILDEKPDETIAPMIECTAADLRELVEFLGLVVAEGNARAFRDLADWASDPAPAADAAVEAAQTADYLAGIARAAIDLADGMDGPGVRSTTVTIPGEMPHGWQGRMAPVMARQAAPPPQESMRLVVALAAGLTDTVWASADRRPGGELAVHVFAHWRVDLAGKSVVLLDGTADIDQLGKLAGGPVVDITPAGRLENVHAVTQRPAPIAKHSSPGRVAAIVAAVLDDLEGHERIGIIGHKRHISALMGEGEESLPAAARARISKASWFGHGPDRASNEWHVACDALVVIGTPRPNPGSVRRRLVVQGDLEAAAMPDGDWCDGTWDASTVDGDFVTLVSRGYRHPTWRAAHQSMVRAALRQAIGRARAGLPEGIPAVVVADEPLGLPVDRRPLLVRRRTAQRVLDALGIIQAAAIAAIERGEKAFVVESGQSGELGSCLNNGSGSPIRLSLSYTVPAPIVETSGKGTIIAAVLRSVVAAAAGVHVKHASDALAELAATGDVHQPEPGYWSTGAAPEDELPLYVRVLPADREAGDTGMGRPPELQARAEAARVTMLAIAATTPHGVVTTGQFLQAEAQAARATAMRKLAEAVEVGAVVQLDRGMYAADLPVVIADPDGRHAECWARGGDGSVITITVSEVPAGERSRRRRG